MNVRGRIVLTSRPVSCGRAEIAGTKARLLVRVKTGCRKHVRDFEWYCRQHGLDAIRLEEHGDGPGFSYGSYGFSTWFDVCGTSSAVIALNDQRFVLESEFVINARVPFGSAGSGPVKPRPAPKTTFTAA